MNHKQRFLMHQPLFLPWNSIEKPGNRLGKKLRGISYRHSNNGCNQRKTVIPLRKDVTDQPVTCRKSVMFDSKAKVGALVQRAHTFKKQRLAEEAKEEAQEEQLVLARAVST
jgi:hypothetical protein